MTISKRQRLFGLLACWLGAFFFIGIWVVLLFVAQPEYVSTIEAAKSTAILTLTEPGKEYFYMTIASTIACLVSGVLFYKDKLIPVIVLVAMHFILALFVYQLDLALIIGAPLVVLVIPQVNSRAVKEMFLILGSLVVAFIVGLFVYLLADSIRIDMYCDKAFNAEGDCYQRDWISYPDWYFSLWGGVTAFLSITLVSILTKSSKLLSSKVTLFVGSVLALVLIGDFVAYFLTVLTGLITLMVAMRLKNIRPKIQR